MLTLINLFVHRYKQLWLHYAVIIVWFWGVNVFTPYISGIYINHIVSGIEGRTFLLLIAIIAAAQILQILLRYVQALVTTKLNYRLIYQISNDLFQKIFVSDYKYYGAIDRSYYIDQINKDSNTVVSFFTSHVINFFLQSATILVSALFVYRADKLLCAIILSLLPFYVLTFHWNKHKMFDAKKAAKKAANAYFSRYSEQIQKLPYIKRNTLNEEMGNRLAFSLENLLQTTLHSVGVEYFFSNLNQVVIVTANLCIIGIGGYKVSTGALSVGYFSIINTYFNMIISSVSYFIGLAGSYQDAKVSYQRIRKIMEMPDEPHGFLCPDEIHRISVEDLSVSYHDNVILNHCNYTFQRGSIYGIRGQNGTGKTTLLNAITGIIAGEHSGTILFDGIDIGQLDMPKLRRQKISCLEQDPVMLNMTVREYLCFGLDVTETLKANQDQLVQALGISHLLDKDMNESGSNFSGGEKQKLAMVRALSKESSLILLDEPTSALDKDSIASLMRILRQRKNNAIVILISHDPEVLAQCDVQIDITEVQTGC